MEACCNQLLELDHGGFTALHAFGGRGSYDKFREVRWRGVRVCCGAQRGGRRGKKTGCAVRHGNKGVHPGRRD
jgi:hypothetical protein